jgi:hypothetical protein
MTPQEKAEELIFKFDTMPNKVVLFLDKDELFESARKAALIAVDEILEDRKEIDGMRVINDPYWLEVKNEIQKL